MTVIWNQTRRTSRLWHLEVCDVSHKSESVSLWQNGRWMRRRYCLKYLDNPDDHVICCWTSNFIFLQRVKVKRGCQKTWQQRGGAPGLSEGSVQLTQLDTRLQTGNCPHKTDGGQSGERGCRTDVVHSEERRQQTGDRCQSLLNIFMLVNIGLIWLKEERPRWFCSSWKKV